LLRRLHGQYSGYSGVAYYSNWLASPWYQLATTNTVWVSTCSSFSTASGANTLDVNGRPSSSYLAGLAVPDKISINSNLASVDAQWSAFGVAELLVWNRAITQTELREAQAYLTLKYGLVPTAPPAPPVPAAPLPPALPLAQSLGNGMMAWCVTRGACRGGRAMRHACAPRKACRFGARFGPRALQHIPSPWR
jgi:hypothetical protein